MICNPPPFYKGGRQKRKYFLSLYSLFALQNYHHYQHPTILNIRLNGRMQYAPTNDSDTGIWEH